MATSLGIRSKTMNCHRISVLAKKKILLTSTDSEYFGKEAFNENIVRKWVSRVNINPRKQVVNELQGLTTWLNLTEESLLQNSIKACMCSMTVNAV